MCAPCTYRYGQLSTNQKWNGQSLGPKHHCTHDSFHYPTSPGTEEIIKNQDVIESPLLKLQPAENREPTGGTLSIYSGHPSTRVCIVV